MRLQTRLFLGTAALVLALMATQWWLHLRQLRAVETALDAVAASVGRDILEVGPRILAAGATDFEHELVWVDGTPTGSGVAGMLKRDVHVAVIPGGGEVELTRTITRKRISADAASDPGVVAEHIDIDAECLGPDSDGAAESEKVIEEDGELRFVLQVVADEDEASRFLVIRSDGGAQQRIPIPVEPAVRTFEATMQRGAAMGGVLLAAGLIGAAVLSSRVTRPLRTLVVGAESVGRGELGAQVPVTASGEVGELQRSFNTMSQRLAELEAERDRWREREHLAQLGDLSRGLAHTVRNPLNTLGLAVEELAAGGDGREDLVVTARTQIRRIDRWLRSFLALGAEDDAEASHEDLADLVRSVVLEAVQQGRSVRLDAAGGRVPVRVVAGGLRAAISNLVDNAADAAPDGAEVEVAVARQGATAVVSVRDHGPGLPDEVRRRLFEPHVTTKVGGSGMGLYLARQLVVGMHGGVLEIEGHPNGGTIAVVKLPIDPVGGDDDA